MGVNTFDCVTVCGGTIFALPLSRLSTWSGLPKTARGGRPEPPAPFFRLYGGPPISRAFPTGGTAVLKYYQYTAVQGSTVPLLDHERAADAHSWSFLPPQTVTQQHHAANWATSHQAQPAWMVVDILRTTWSVSSSTPSTQPRPVDRGPPRALLRARLYPVQSLNYSTWQPVSCSLRQTGSSLVHWQHCCVHCTWDSTADCFTYYRTSSYVLRRSRLSYTGSSRCVHCTWDSTTACYLLIPYELVSALLCGFFYVTVLDSNEFTNHLRSI
eukprot:SAG25_NODE_316_length_9962_cov_5.659637_1_plen_270_part_00